MTLNAALTPPCILLSLFVRINKALPGRRLDLPVDGRMYIKYRECVPTMIHKQARATQGRASAVMLFE
jgi:hypothetical protein